jgi:hypothetical protein
MKISMSVAILTVFFSLFHDSAHAQQSERDIYESSLVTEAGELEITRRADVESGYQVTLDGRIILRTDADDSGSIYSGNYIPKIHTYYKPGLENFGGETVLLEFISGGNACPGGSLQFLNLRRNELPRLSNLVDACIPPIVTWDYGKVTLFFPRSPVIRGTGFVPAETWVYQNGNARKVSAVSNRARRR